MRKKSTVRKQTKQNTSVSFLAHSLIVIVTIILAIFSGVLFQNLTTNSAVLGASTMTQQQSGFSFSTFFASFFAFFSPSHASSSGSLQTTQNTIISPSQSITNNVQVDLTNSQLLIMAGNAYTNGQLPLGDTKYVTDTPKKGYIYLCHVMTGGGGAEHAGSWLGTTTWTPTEKPTVEGSVSWPNATFSNTISGNSRLLTGNDLPVGGHTGIFPIQSTDPASQYDRNPNTILAQSIELTLPVSPQYLDTPSCMGGEVGVMLNGVALFNGFDAENRDAAAHEIQDSCDGHPESDGEYHYHSLSRCITNTNIKTVIGFALDGFPITGSMVSNGKYLTTQALDTCHGLTSEIRLDGKTVTMYHYVMTQDFPYSVSCFRGKPVSLQVIAGAHNGSGHMQNQKGQGSTIQMQMNIPIGGHSMSHGSPMSDMPPQGAISACSGQSDGASCSFTIPNGTISGTCHTPPNQTSPACIPGSQ